MPQGTLAAPGALQNPLPTRTIPPISRPHPSTNPQGAPPAGAGVLVQPLGAQGHRRGPGHGHHRAVARADASC